MFSRRTRTIFALAVVLLVLWTLCTLQMLFNMLLTPRLLRGKPSGAYQPLVSVIIPARDEAATIGTTLESFLAQTWRRIEIIVVDDRSSDETATIVEAFTLRDRRVRLVRGADHPDGWLGKPWALHQGSGCASGEWLLFVDADVRYRPEAIESALALAERESSRGMIFFFPRFEMVGFWENALMPALPGGFLTGIPVWLSNATTIPLLGLGGGVGNMVRAAAYREIGGHTRLSNAVIDDVGMGRMIRAHGWPTLAVRADDMTSVRMYHGGRQIIDGFTKNAYMALAGTLPRAIGFLALLVAMGGVPWLFGMWLAAAAARGTSPPDAAIVGTGSLALLILSRVVMFGSLRYKLSSALFAQPLELVVWIWIFLRSTWKVGVLGKLHWRGRLYESRVTPFGDFSGLPWLGMPRRRDRIQ